MTRDPVLYRTAFIDDRTNTIAREWVRFFDQLGNASLEKSNVFTGSNTFTKAVAINTLPGVAPSLTITAQDYQAGMELWDKQVNVGGAIPAGGSHWRLFADNVGGGGGNITCGFYDVAANRVAGGFDNSGVFIANQGLNVINPANITFGSNWLNWSPSVTGWAGMTVSGLSSVQALYLRIGPIVHFAFFGTMNLGGTASDQIFISTAVPIAGGTSFPINASVNYTGSWVNAWGYSDPSGSLHKIFLNGGGNFPLTNISVFVSGFYRC